MGCLGNIIWIVFGGFIAALGYLLGGLAMCITIIGIPFGLQAFKLAGLALAPFGREVKPKERASGLIPMIFNILWLVIFGWTIALVHLVSALILAITIIGIPFAQQHFKLLQVALFPFSYEVN
jgi:uncharacterized membrane protein YccF (DUF307 family)